VIRRVRQWHCRAAAGAALRHIRHVWPELVPEEVCGALPVATWRALVTRPLLADHPLDLFRATRKRRVQLYLAAVFLDDPTRLPGWLWHRATRDRRAGGNPLDAVGDLDR
jgi:hypothetical protein